jgi:hypothetical protein
MECRNIREKLSDYVDNELSDEEKKLVDEHLNACQKCSHALEELRKIVALTHRMEEAEPPPWLEQKVMAELKGHERRKEGFFQKLFFPVHTGFPIEIIATIALAVTAFFVFRAVEPEIEKMPRKQAVKQSESERAISEEREYEAKEGLLLKQDIKEPPVASAPVKRKMRTAEPETPAERMEVLKEQTVMEEEMMFQDSYKDVDKKAGRGRMAFAPGVVGTFEKKNEIINVTVHVENIEASISRIEKVIKELKGEVVRTEQFDDKVALSVMLESGRINELRKELRVIGEVDEILPVDLQGEIELKIEFVKILK